MRCLLRRLLATLIVCLLLSDAIYACGPGPRLGGNRPSPKDLTPLLRGEYWPRLSEATIGASGPSEGRIFQGTSRFDQLVSNYNPYVVFKNAHKDSSVRIMTQRCEDRVNTLGMLVMNHWPGVRLRIIKAWDSASPYDEGVLHGEGRAVDITTSDYDRRKYGKLARLAVEAGFDWIHYKSSYYVHVSVRSDDADTVKYGGCFPASSTLRLRDGRSVTMGNLSLGDEILAVDRSTGEFVYSEVISFMDRQRRRLAEYFEIVTSARTLTLTSNHMLFVTDNCPNDTDGQSARLLRPITDWSAARAVYASEVAVGQCVFAASTSNNFTESYATPALVTGVRKVVRKGVFAPLTAHGTLVVDDTVASCYGLFSSERLAHAAFFPIRHLKKFFLEVDKDIEGIHWYSRTLLSVAEYLFPRSWFHIR